MMVVVWRCVLVMLVVMCACLCGYTEAVGGAKSRQRPQRRPPKEPKVEPVDQLIPTQNINIPQMTGKWYLLNVASKCPHLIKHGTQVEPTTMTLSQSSTPDKTLSVSTKTRHNHQCWEILQVYYLTPTSGRLILNGKFSRNHTCISRFLALIITFCWEECFVILILSYPPGTQPGRNTEISIKETDYTTYAIIYYRKYGKVTMKLYSRVTDDLSEPLLTKFEEQAEKQGLGLAYHFPFPTYSHCGDTDQDHIINCVPTC
ncbi:complement component C8 gamma chain isoform X1 [Gouania willdenowi]|uniref:Lipocalin/cytosolic fatty-acid binding domain-containing protein n=1 Tax=Gouania willdenowi TaxID=441366 RepID=A0A8C5ETH4_GOUWI|nr:complement component C8 gamma chain isoform X1 [Gouania willdenowi]